MKTTAQQPMPMPDGQDSQHVKDTYRKIIWRLLPFLFFAYIINAIDRINISYAKLQMAADLGLTDAAYALGASAFFLGYILFEIPSNYYMQKIGARATIMRIMILWGMVTAATSLVTTPGQLQAARFLLGVAEAGFFPGVILYLTYWFPGSYRGRITSVFLMAGTIAGILSGPLAGAIMTHFDGWHGMKGWQLLFILEGIPAMLMGVFAFFWIKDGPRQVSWLSAEQKAIVEKNLEADNAPGKHGGSFLQVLRDPRVYIAGLAFFSIYTGTNTIAYWMPTLIKEFGQNSLANIGLISSLPYLLGLVAMYLLGRSSDKRRERRWHTAAAMLTAAASFIALSLVQGNMVISIAVMTVGAAACLAALPTFWTIPPAYLRGKAAASGIAFISSLGGVAAMVSPLIVGAIKTRTGSLYLAFGVIGVLLIVGALSLLIGIPARALQEAKKD